VTGVFENLLQNGILHFVFKLSQTSKIVLQGYNIYTYEKLTLLKRVWARIKIKYKVRPILYNYDHAVLLCC